MELYDELHPSGKQTKLNVMHLLKNSSIAVKQPKWISIIDDILSLFNNKK